MNVGGVGGEGRGSVGNMNERSVRKCAYEWLSDGSVAHIRRVPSARDMQHRADICTTLTVSVYWIPRIGSYSIKFPSKHVRARP